MITTGSLIKEPKISLIITYHNLGKYIDKCIQSILFQEYKNFEIIIVNDFSDEENSAVLKKYSFNEKIKIINLDKNQGQLIAFCEGLKISQGEFVCMIDADDVLLPNYLKTLLFIHLNNNIALVSSQKGVINEKDEIISLNNKYKINNNLSYREIEELFKIKDEFDIKKVKAPFALWSWNPATSSMFRKEALEILKYYPDKEYWKTGADKVVFSLLHLIGGSANISCVCYLYRQHDNNNSQTQKPTGKMKYLKDDYVQKLIDWNIKLRLDTLKMFRDNKKEFIQKFNRINYVKMLVGIIFCINFKVLIKMIKAFVFKFLKI